MRHDETKTVAADRLLICFNHTYEKPVLIVARTEGVEENVINSFYDDAAINTLQKLTDMPLMVNTKDSIVTIACAYLKLRKGVRVERVLTTDLLAPKEQPVHLKTLMDEDARFLYEWLTLKERKNKDGDEA